MIAFIYQQDNSLKLRNEKGLRWEYEQTDAPSLGFEYDYIIYDDQKIKIIKKDDEEVVTDLTNDEIDAIEKYVLSAEPPEGVCLNQQYADDLWHFTAQNVREMCNQLRFGDIVEANVAGREGSNHPFRSDARRCLEFYDQAYLIFEELKNQIVAAPEDQLQDFDYYQKASLRPVMTEFLTASDEEK